MKSYKKELYFNLPKRRDWLRKNRMINMTITDLRIMRTRT